MPISGWSIIWGCDTSRKSVQDVQAWSWFRVISRFHLLSVTLSFLMKPSRKLPLDWRFDLVCFQVCVKKIHIYVSQDIENNLRMSCLLGMICLLNWIFLGTTRYLPSLGDFVPSYPSIGMVEGRSTYHTMFRPGNLTKVLFSHGGEAAWLGHVGSGDMLL